MHPSKYLRRFRLIVDFLDKQKPTRAVLEQLSEHGEILDIKTVQNYLRSLYEQGVVDRFQTHAKRKGYEWKARPVPFYLNRDLMFEMALVLMIARDQLECIVTPKIFSKVEPTFDQAAETVDAEGRQIYANWPEKVRVVPYGFVLQKPEIDIELLEQVVQAVMTEEVVKFETHSLVSKDAPYEVTARAVGFFYRGNVPYLVGLVSDDRKPEGHRIVHYPLARMEQFRVALDLDELPTDFDFSDYAKQGQLGFPLKNYHIPDLGGDIVFEAEVFVSVAREIHAASLSADQQLEKIEGRPDYYRLKVTVPGTLSFAQWVIARSPYLKVKGPELFRAYVEREILQAAAHVKSEQWEVPPYEAIGEAGKR